MTRRAIEWGASAVLLACLVLMLVRTFDWPLISDAVLMHYVVLLMQHGWAPYRDIVDVNMPGSYLVDLAVTKLLGTGPVGWRLFDYALMVAAGVSIVAILRARSLFAGLFGAALFAITHIADGVAQAGQRDFVVAVLLVAGFRALVRTPSRGVRLEQLSLEQPYMSQRGASWQFFFFGLCCGAAATIKPPALVFALLLPAAAMIRRREPAYVSRSARLRCLASGATGLGVPLVGVLLWLWSTHSLRAFFDAARGLVLYHAGMARHSLGFLLLHAVPSQVLPVAVIAVGSMIVSMTLLVGSHASRRLDPRLSLLAIMCGLVFFCAQGKAYPYHRYPLLAFLWVFIAMQIAEALTVPKPTFGARRLAQPSRRHLLPAILAWTAIAYCVLWLAPASTARALRYDWRAQPSLDQLRADLAQVAANLPAAGAGPLADLDRHVQCMDTMAGCITVLDRMQLVQATGFLYDCYFFAPGANPVKQSLQRQFLAQVRHAPPAVFIVTDQWCLDLPGGYRKLDQWPEFAAYLAAHYRVAQQRAWPSGGSRRHLATLPFGYRLYLRNESRN